MRKITQIVAVEDAGGTSLFAVCSDGTLWVLPWDNNKGWELFKFQIPQDGVLKPKITPASSEL